MAKRHPHTGHPGLVNSMLEARSVFELMALPYAWPFLAMAPRGDGHPVLLLPGFMGSEVSLIGLQVFLRGRGYDVQTWGLGRNVGFRPGHASAIEQKIRYMHHASGQKVSLIGWSLGGVFAMYGAHKASECVRNVITLGSPVSVDATGSASPPLVKALYRLVAHPMGTAAHAMQPRAKTLREGKPLTVPGSGTRNRTRRRRLNATDRVFSSNDRHQRWRGGAASPLCIVGDGRIVHHFAAGSWSNS